MTDGAGLVPAPLPVSSNDALVRYFSGGPHGD